MARECQIDPQPITKHGLIGSPATWLAGPITRIDTDHPARLKTPN
jgi:hypothetical protein